MKSAVIIKGNKLGFQIVLNPSLPFEELRREVEDKFRQADRFFDEKTAYAISFEGRDLTPGEQNILVDTISGCCKLHIGYLVDGARAVETDYARAIAGTDPEPEEGGDLPEAGEDLQPSGGMRELLAEEPFETDEEEETPEGRSHDQEAEPVWEPHFPENRIGMNGQFYRGTLRSGQKIEVPGSIVILGDINPGAQIIAGGNVVILGCLKGIVYAGFPDDETAIVASLLMSPMQIQIGRYIARAPDEQTEKKKFRKKKKTETFAPKIAFVEENNIVIDSISKELISEMSNSSELKGEKHE